MLKWTSIFILFLNACSSSTSDQWQKQGKNEIREIVQVLREIDGPKDFATYQGTLTSHFNELSKIIVKLDQVKREVVDCAANQQLKQELNRIHSLPGGKEWIESCQENAVEFLSRQQY